MGRPTQKGDSGKRQGFVLMPKKYTLAKERLERN